MTTFLPLYPTPPLHLQTFTLVVGCVSCNFEVFFSCDVKFWCRILESSGRSSPRVSSTESVTELYYTIIKHYFKLVSLVNVGVFLDECS